MPTPTPTGLPHIASAFDPMLGMRPSWGTGAIPVSAAPDVVGAFRMTCAAGDLGYIDPIVYPGTDGVSHLHQFYGLTGVSPTETYESARTGNRFSTCGVADYSLNKSLYWLPALLDGRGNVIQPDLVSIYYKRRPKADPVCNWNTHDRGVAEECVNMPQGLRIVAGAIMDDGEALANRAVPGGGFCGKSFHGDALFAWDPVAWQAFHDHCIDRLLNCSGGDLGNGWQLRGASQPSYGWTNPVRLVPVP